MKLYRADKNQLVREIKVGPKIQISGPITPGRHKYYVIIDCAESSLTYRSPIFELGTVEEFEHPVDLGTVSLKTENK
jgi:hypothetical protein